MFIIPLIIIYVGTKYTLSEYLLEDQFSFVSELNRFFELSLIFSIVFLVFLLFEIYIFNQRQHTYLRNLAIIFSIFTSIVVIALFYANGIY